MSSAEQEQEQVQRHLFPAGVPAASAQLTTVLEQYKLFLATAESIETRRQTLHTFFMSINSLLLAASGLIGKQALDTPRVGAGVVLLGLLGAVLSVSWLQQVKSHGHVMKSKWEIINAFEAVLPSQPFCGEWQSLQRRSYRSFTDIERYMPIAFIVLYALAGITGLLLALQVI